MLEADAFDTAKALERISEIDRLFDTPKRWGSWMVGAANERAALVTKLREHGFHIKHKWLVRIYSGHNTDLANA